MESHRGISPVIGVVLMIVILLLLVSVFAAGVITFGEGLNETPIPGRDDSTLSGNPLSGSQGDLVRVSTTRAGATDVTYRVNVTIDEDSDTIGNSLNSIELEAMDSEPDLFSETEDTDLVRVGIDENSTGSIDEEITDDVDEWETENDGAALKIGFSGSAYTPSANDSVIVIFEGANNPETAGEYDLRAQTSGDGNWHYGTITITESSRSLRYRGDPLATTLWKRRRSPITGAHRRRREPSRPRFAGYPAVGARQWSPAARGSRRRAPRPDE